MRTIQVSGGKDWRKHVERLAQSPEARAGVMDASPGGAKYPDGTSAVLVAALQEFGGEHIPPRPFLKQTVTTRWAAWSDRLKHLLRRGFTPEQAMEEMGRTMMEDIQATIDDSLSWAAPNSPLTLARKESDRPLYHTGVLRGAIWYEVKK